MFQLPKPAVPASVALLATLLSGCGGGSVNGSTSTTPTQGSSPTGLYNGTTGNNQSTVGVLLTDGSYWTWYSAAFNPTVPAGLIQGSGTSSGSSSNSGTFSSSNGKDFNLQGNGIAAVSVSANYVASTSLSGTLSYGSGSPVSFSSAYNSDFLTAPSLATIAGTYTGLGSSVLSSATFANLSTTITIAGSGAISGFDITGCNFSGTASPYAGGNAYTLLITFAGGSCALGTTSVSGIAVYTSSSGQLHAAGLDSTRSVASLFTGTKG